MRNSSAKTKKYLKAYDAMQNILFRRFKSVPPACLAAKTKARTLPGYHFFPGDNLSTVSSAAVEDRASDATASSGVVRALGTFPFVSCPSEPAGELFTKNGHPSSWLSRLGFRGTGAMIGDSGLEVLGDAMGFLDYSGSVIRREDFVGGFGEEREPALEVGWVEGELEVFHHGVAFVAASR